LIRAKQLIDFFKFFPRFSEKRKSHDFLRG